MTAHPCDQHLDEHALSAAVAGLDLEARDRQHLDGCLTCRRRVESARSLLEAARDRQRADEPDWWAQHRAIMARLPGAAPLAPVAADQPAAAPGWPARLLRRPAVRRPLMAAAAALIVAVGLLALNRPWQPTQSPAGDIAVEDILAEVDAMLAEDQLPGFEPLEPIVPDLDEIQAYSASNGAS